MNSNDPLYFLIVISGPSGAGKSTLVNALLEDPLYELSVSCTTRQKRPKEEHGKEYYFLTQEEFQQKIRDGQFLEYAVYAGNYYGTLFSEVQRIQQKAHCLLDVDIQGVRSLRNYPQLPKNSVFLFIEPPSLEILKQRLMGRDNNSDFRLEERLKLAEKELCQKDLCDHVFQNHQQEQMIREVKDYLEARFRNSSA